MTAFTAILIGVGLCTIIFIVAYLISTRNDKDAWDE